MGIGDGDEELFLLAGCFASKASMQQEIHFLTPLLAHRMRSCRRCRPHRPPLLGIWQPRPEGAGKGQ